MLFDPNPSPHLHGIVGECNNCHFVYGLQWGFCCPRCHRTELRRVTAPVAAYGTELAPWPHVLNSEGTACRWDCPACTWVKEEQPAITELDKMFALKDPR